MSSKRCPRESPGKSSEVLPPEKCLKGPGLTGPPDDVTTDDSDDRPPWVLNLLNSMKKWDLNL